MTAATAKPIAAQWRGIFFDGPQSDQNRVGDEDASPVSTVYHCHKFKSAEVLAKRMARDRDLELIHEAMPD